MKWQLHLACLVVRVRHCILLETVMKKWWKKMKWTLKKMNAFLSSSSTLNGPQNISFQSSKWLLHALVTKAMCLVHSQSALTLLLCHVMSQESCFISWLWMCVWVKIIFDMFPTPPPSTVHSTTQCLEILFPDCYLHFPTLLKNSGVNMQ